MPTPDTLTKRSIAAIAEAGWSAGACALIAVAVYAFEGDAIVAGGGIPLYGLLAIYAGCAIVAGTVLGITRPLITGWRTAALVSIPVAWPVTFSAALLSREGRLCEMDSLDFTISVASAVVMGPLSAAYVRVRRKQ
jgi:hypothetical protein